MSEIIGFDMTPDMGTSLRKVLKYDLAPHMEKFESISAGASKVSNNVSDFLLVFTFLDHCRSFLLRKQCRKWN